MSAIFLLPVCLTYWPRNYTTLVDPTLIIRTKFEVDMTIHCRVIAICLLIHHETLWPWPWPFNLEHLQCMAGHVTNFATKLEDPMPIRSWFMRYNVSHWLPLKMRQYMVISTPHSWRSRSSLVGDGGEKSTREMKWKWPSNLVLIIYMGSTHVVYFLGH